MTQGADQPVRPVNDLMERVAVAWETGDYDTLREFLHPEGSWALISNEPSIYSDRDELLEAIRFLREWTCYRIYTMEHEVPGENVVLASTYIRTPAGKHGHRVARHYFLLEAKDGLLCRREHFDVEADARTAFAEGWGGGQSAPASGRARAVTQAVGR